MLSLQILLGEFYKHTGVQPLKNDDLNIEQTRPKDGESFHQSVELITIQRTDHQKTTQPIYKYDIWLVQAWGDTTIYLHNYIAVNYTRTRG